jgi:hypothetical protein
MRGNPMGRPPKSPEFKRTAQLRIMLTNDERAQLDRAVPENLSVWARDVLLREVRKLLKK